MVQRLVMSCVAAGSLVAGPASAQVSAPPAAPAPAAQGPAAGAPAPSGGAGGAAPAAGAATPAAGQTRGGAGAPAAPAPAASPRAAVPTVKQVLPATVALKDAVDVTVEGFDAWAAEHAADLENLVLYVDGYPIRKLVPRRLRKDQIRFTLARHGDSRSEWAALLGRPTLTPRPVVVQLGVKGLAPFDGGTQVNLDTLDGSYLALAGGAFVALLLGFIIVARRSDLLREGRMAVGAADRRPFSLGRTQMAVWFFIVVASFLFIWIVTGAYDPLTGSVLGLIGISAGTALGAMVIDANKDATLDNHDKGLQSERLRIETEIASLRTTIAETQQQRGSAPAGTDLAALDQRITERQADVAAKTTRLQQIDDELRAVARSVQPSTSAGFWTDLMSDENGVSFHRFQIAVWTMVLAVIFVYTVYDSLAMPDFDEKLLALMGLSSGTYLGFKFPEGQ